MVLIFVLALLGFAYFFGKPLWIKFKRQRIASQPFPKEWRQIIRKNVPYFNQMPSDLQLQLKQHILVFLAEKKFYGQDGLEMTDEIRVTIAAQACLLLLNRKTNYFEKLHSVYVLPTAFVAKNPHVDALGVWHEQSRVLLGESWDIGKVILSWQHTQEGAEDTEDGINLIIHEFAHQLDQETGPANGAPRLSSKAQYKDWYNVMNRQFQRHKKAVEQRLPTLLNYYGATNEAEFFAVASETFFERPSDMHEQHRGLYDQLKNYYKVDPLTWR